MRWLLIRCANGHQPTADELAVAQEFVGHGPRVAAGEYLPNYNPFVAERLTTQVLEAK